MINRAMAVMAAVLFVGSAIPSPAQPPSPRPRPPMNEAAETRALNDAQLRGVPGYLPASYGLRTTKTDYMSPYLRNRSGTAAKAGARSMNDGLGAQKTIQRQ